METTTQKGSAEHAHTCRRRSKVASVWAALGQNPVGPMAPGVPGEPLSPPSVALSLFSAQVHLESKFDPAWFWTIEKWNNIVEALSCLASLTPHGVYEICPHYCT